MRKPLSHPEIIILHELNPNPIHICHTGNAVAAGFPSPATDYLEEDIDLNAYLKPRPMATFLVRVQGDSMKDAHITNGSLLIVDKSLKPANNSIIIAVVDNEFTVKRLVRNSSGIHLMPANDKFKPIHVTEEMDFRVWGVVTKIITDADKV